MKHTSIVLFALFLMPSLSHASSGEFVVSMQPEWLMEIAQSTVDHGIGTSLAANYTLTDHIFVGSTLRFMDYGGRQPDPSHGEKLRRFDAVPCIGLVFGNDWKFRTALGVGLRMEHARERWQFPIDGIAPIDENYSLRARGVAELQMSLSYRVPRDVGGSLEIGLQANGRHGLGINSFSPEIGAALMVAWWWLG